MSHSLWFPLTAKGQSCFCEKQKFKILVICFWLSVYSKNRNSVFKSNRSKTDNLFLICYSWKKFFWFYCLFLYLTDIFFLLYTEFLYLLETNIKKTNYLLQSETGKKKQIFRQTISVSLYLFFWYQFLKDIEILYVKEKGYLLNTETDNQTRKIFPWITDQKQVICFASVAFGNRISIFTINR